MRKLMIGAALAVVASGVLAAPQAAAAPAGSTEVAASSTVILPAGRIPPSGRYIPPKVGSGDADFDGNGPHVEAWAQLFGIGTNQLQARIAMDAVETTSDFTHASGLSGWFLFFQAPAGQCIESVSRDMFEPISYTDTATDRDDNFPGAPGSFVSSWSFVGDTGGNEAGTRTGVVIFTPPMSVTYGPC